MEYKSNNQYQIYNSLTKKIYVTQNMKSDKYYLYDELDTNL